MNRVNNSKIKVWFDENISLDKTKEIKNNYTDQEIVDLMFSKFSRIDYYQKISASHSTNTINSVLSVIKGMRPLALAPASIGHPAGMKEALLMHKIGIIKMGRISQKNAANEVSKRNFRNEWVPCKLGMWNNWIIYRKDSKKKAIKLARVFSSKDEYRCQRIGRLLSYPENEIKEFCLKNKFSYSKNLPPLKKISSDFEHQIKIVSPKTP